MDGIGNGPGQDVEGFICPPSGFIEQHWPHLLPDWTTSVLSVLMLLQRSPVMLCIQTPETEASKGQLRDRAFYILEPLIQHLRTSNHHADLFDPRTGLPRYSQHNGMALNDVAVIHNLLGYALKQCGECHCILHPRWSSRVYPSIVLSSAHPHELEAIARQCLQSIPIGANPSLNYL